jgi:hypothetical protein
MERVVGVLGLAVGVVLVQSSKFRVAMQRVWARDLVGGARDVGSVVVAVAWLVVAVGKDGQVALRLCRRQLWLCTGFVERLSGRVGFGIQGFLLDGATHALSARVALAAVVVS